MSDCTPQIEFSKDIYSPGEEVTGRAWISTKKDLTARNVKITFTGRTLTAWKGKKPVANPGAKKAEDIHVQMSHEVWEPEDEKNIFPSGDYEWNFSFELPKDCPASVEGKYGFIRYSVLVEFIGASWKDNRVEGAVTVTPRVDLNTIQGAGNMVRKQIEQVSQLCGCLPLNCGPFKKGTVMFTFLLPNLGYVPGETISMTGLVENHTSRSIRAIEGSFIRMITYRVDTSKGGKKKEVDNKNNCRKEVQTLKLKKEEWQVPAGESKEIAFTLEIPPVVATIKNSQFLSVEYFVRINTKFAGLSCSDVKADAIVIIGNVPLDSPEFSVPVQSFARVDPAQCWSAYFKPSFVPQVPYFGRRIERD